MTCLQLYSNFLYISKGNGQPMANDQKVKPVMVSPQAHLVLFPLEVLIGLATLD